VNKDTLKEGERGKYHNRSSLISQSWVCESVWRVVRFTAIVIDSWNGDVVTAITVLPWSKTLNLRLHHRDRAGNLRWWCAMVTLFTVQWTETVL